MPRQEGGGAAPGAEVVGYPRGRCAGCGEDVTADHGALGHTRTVPDSNGEAMPMSCGPVHPFASPPPERAGEQETLGIDRATLTSAAGVYRHIPDGPERTALALCFGALYRLLATSPAPSGGETRQVRGQWFALPSGPGSDVGPFSTQEQAEEWLRAGAGR